MDLSKCNNYLVVLAVLEVDKVQNALHSEQCVEVGTIIFSYLQMGKLRLRYK